MAQTPPGAQRRVDDLFLTAAAPDNSVEISIIGWDISILVENDALLARIVNKPEAARRVARGALVTVNIHFPIKRVQGKLISSAIV